MKYLWLNKFSSLIKLESTIKFKCLISFINPVRIEINRQLFTKFKFGETIIGSKV